MATITNVELIDDSGPYEVERLRQVIAVIDYVTPDAGGTPTKPPNSFNQGLN
jgi:hypothetical protein